MGSTDCGVPIDVDVPSAVLTHIKFGVLTEADIDKLSVSPLHVGTDVTSPKLGLPNEASECSTCGSSDVKHCEGHFGYIKLPMDICHPYYIQDLLKVLNSICPACKRDKRDKRESRTKGSSKKASKSTSLQFTCCNYCGGSSEDYYPPLTFKAASRNSLGKMASAVLVEISEKLPKKFHNKKLNDVLPADFWNFIKSDPSVEDISVKSHVKCLSPSQIYYLIKDMDQKIIGELVQRRESLFLTCLPVTANGNRLMEAMNRLIFDERTKAYKRLVDFKGQVNDLGLRVRDCLAGSKLHTESYSKTDIRGKKWLKDVILAKRTDHSFRMVVVGDPNIGFGEIGLPHNICRWLMTSETINTYNQEKVHTSCNWSLLETREFRVRRKGDLVTLRSVEDLEIGDTIFRYLDEGDIVLVNRPPSIHQHSLLALSVRVLPMDSVVSLNPVCCSPLRGDFDGDCLHGYIPQSVKSTVELRELVAIKHQLVNGQNGRNLLSLCHDSMTAAYLLRKKGVFLNKFDMQQLEMLCEKQFVDPACERQFTDPAILKASSCQNSLWTGTQLLSMLFPLCFDYSSPSKSIHIDKGDILYSSLESSWLQDTDGNIFSSLVEHYGIKALDILFSAQKVLLEWISMRGFSVSLSDLFICDDVCSRKKMLEEVYCGLHEAEQRLYTKHLVVEPGREVPKVGKRMTDLNRLSVGAFKEVFRDLQTLVYPFAGSENSLLAMVKAGSKGNLLKVIQQGVTLGLQYSNVPLSFSIPWDPLCGPDLGAQSSSSELNVPYAVVSSSFLNGLNPMECFMHSVSSRSTSFADHADVPGTLHRKLMFYMRDLYVAYDATVRSSFGNQLVQFSYGGPESLSAQNESNHKCFSKEIHGCGDIGGPVGSSAACSITEAAYSALDQPISTLESSPLLNLKKLLESSQKKNIVNQTVSLFLSKKLERWLYGFEYAAIKVKSHLERVLFSDVVTSVMITSSAEKPQKEKAVAREGRTGNMVGHFSPWTCHFHFCKERMKKRALHVQSIRDVLDRECSIAGEKLKLDLPRFQVLTGTCPVADSQKENDGPLCITVKAEVSTSFIMTLDTFQGSVIPHLLGTVIKGFLEFKKVDILWNDFSLTSKSEKISNGELYLKVHISEAACKSGECMRLVMSKCLPMMDMVDWTRSSPDSIPDIYNVYGIGCAREYFLASLKAIVSDIGKSIFPKHLLLVADCLSVTGEFIGLSAKGIAKQRDMASVSSPFAQACFSSPESCFIKAAKEGAEDCLLGALDAAAWGKEVPLGTGGQFELLCSRKGQTFIEPLDVYSALSGIACSKTGNPQISVCLTHEDSRENVEEKSMLSNELLSLSKSDWTAMNFILGMCLVLQDLLHHKYKIDDLVSDSDKKRVMEALRYHPRTDEKVGCGVQYIKVGYHPRFQESRCFFVVREDGSTEDFSYNKCIYGALKGLNLPPDFMLRLQKANPKAKL
ncbi:DNA-directed RNA polymerase [Ranunculus cassubicifolius]